jgi:RNA polymerase sigma-70 factor (ECF subfamily)
MIARLVSNPAAAEEILHQTFWQVWQEASHFSGQTSATAWLYRLARTKCLEQLRRRGTHSPGHEPDQDTSLSN